MHALARLIEDVRAAQGWNQSEVARRSGLSRSRIAQLINEPIRAVPSRETIIQLARGLNIPAWVVMDAFLESLGLPSRPSHIGIEEAIAADVSLSAADKRAVLAFLTHIRRESAAAEPAGQLVDLARPPQPDLSRVAARWGESEGRRLPEEQDENDPS